jgi:hypothetical protein
MSSPRWQLMQGYHSLAARRHDSVVVKTPVPLDEMKLGKEAQRCGEDTEGHPADQQYVRKEKTLT